MADIINNYGGGAASEGMGSEIFSSNPKTTAAPEPNPHFSFPLLSNEESESPSFERRNQSRYQPRSRPQNITTSPLPPLAPLPQTSPSNANQPEPTPSPSRSINIPSRGHGHRRGGSEFIGGDGSMAGPGLMSTSPTKGEGVLPSPPPAANRRRGHAHRRSGAISSHDLSFMLNPKTEKPTSRSGSVPNSPSPPFLGPPSTTERPTSRCSAVIPEDSTVESPTASPKRNSAGGQPRPRVGFSDTLEFIPRPLSTISSETSSSLSTIRASHSVTGSITSIISIGTPSPPSTKKTQYTQDVIREYRSTEVRPKTADDSLNSSPLGSPFRRASPPVMRPSSAGAGKALKKPETAPVAPMQQEFAKSLTNKITEATVDRHGKSKANQGGDEDSKHSSNILARRSRELLSRPRSSPEIKGSKQKKVKSWADSFLRRSKSKEFSEPAAEKEEASSFEDFAPLEDCSLDDVNFDDDNTLVIRSPSFAPTVSETSNRIEKMASESRLNDFVDSEGVLDLDAVYGQDMESSNGQKRRLHSSGSTGGFFGPGMHYHRRAESAPVLTSLSPSFGPRKFGSNQQMADVFEEEEEDEDQARKTHLVPGDTASVERHSSDNLKPPGSEVHTARSSFERFSPNPSIDQRSFAGSQYASSFNDRSTATESSRSRASSDVPVEILDSEAEDEPRLPTLTKRADDATIAAKFANPFQPTPIITAVPSTAELQRSRYFFGSAATSPHASPDPGHISFDAPPLRPTTSSLTERSTWSSLRPGETVPSLCYSSEDVPSLTSSASTTVSGHPSQFSPEFTPTGSGERSYSVSDVPRRSRPSSASKRSSLASLSRLVGASHSEKSKLSVASFATDYTDKPELKKRNRISRMVKFWKSKDRSAHDSSESLQHA